MDEVVLEKNYTTRWMKEELDGCACEFRADKGRLEMD